MLSSLGFDPKGTGRNNRTGPSRFFPDIMHRGISTHFIKNALVPSQPAQPPPAPKYDPAQARPPTSVGVSWSRQPSYQPSRNEQDRKQPPVALSQDRRLVQVTQPVSQPWPVDTKYSKSQSKGYLIHPSPENDMYIYERSILSADDGLSSSPSSDESSDLELFPETTLALARLEISSTRASSSTETLESTLYNTSRNAITGGGGAAPSLSQTQRPPLAITAPPPPPPHPSSTRTAAESSIPVIPVRPPLVRTESSYRPRKDSISRAVHPVQFAGAGSDSSDSETLFSEPEEDNMVVDMMGASQWAMAAGVAHSARSATPFQRVPSSAPAPARARRESLDTYASRPSAPPPQGRSPMEDPSYPRAPPGLYGVATPPDADAQHSGTGQSPLRGAAAPPAPGPSTPNTSPSSSAARAQLQQQQQQQAQMQMSKSMSGSPPQLARTTSSVRAPEAPVRNETSAGAPSTSPPRSSPPRRDSGPSTVQGSPTQPEGVVIVAASKRSVRWTENLVCPSPMPPEQRRKGWFNRRGDQLWTNDGQYKSPEPGQQYPPDLANYPEPNVGWMNEDGVRIDMQHRLVPKRPLRSALKQSKSTV